MFEIQNDLGRRLFCGPTVICLVTGVPASRVEQMLRRARNDWHRKQTGTRYYDDHKRRQFKGTYHSEMVTVLERLGCKVEPYKFDPEAHCTVERFKLDTSHMSDVFVVSAGSHLQAIERGQVYNSWHPRARVVKVWRVVAPSTPKYTTGVTRKAKPKVERDIRVDRAKKIEAQIQGWTSKLKRAQNALSKLRPKLRRYQKLGVIQ